MKTGRLRGPGRAANTSGGTKGAGRLLLALAMVLAATPVLLVATATPAHAAARGPTNETGQTTYLDRIRCGVAFVGSTWDLDEVMTLRCYFDPNSIGAEANNLLRVDVYGRDASGVTSSISGTPTGGGTDDVLTEVAKGDGWLSLQIKSNDAGTSKPWVGIRRVYMDAGPGGSGFGGHLSANETSPEHTYTDGPQAVWPADWYPAGTQHAEPSLDGAAAALECGGNTFQDTSGSWWVSLYGRLLEDVPDGSLVEKAWIGTWDTEGGLVGEPTSTDEDNRLTAPLPSPFSRPEYGWVGQLRIRVKFPTGTYGPPLADDPNTVDDGAWEQDENGGWWWAEPKYIAGLASTTGILWKGAATAGISGVAGQAFPVIAAAVLSYNTTLRTLEYFDPFDWHTDVDPVALGPAFKGSSPAGARFLVDEEQVAPTEIYNEYELVCSVPVVPGEHFEDNVVDPPNDEAEEPAEGGGGQGSEGGCGSNRFGWIPWIGDAISGFTQLACIIGKGFGKLVDALWALLSPEDIDFDGFLDDLDCSAKFPCSLFGMGWDLVSGIFNAATEGAGTSACFQPIGFSVNEDIEFKLRLPTPPDSGCPGNGPDGARTEGDDEAGDLFGYRTTVRSVLSLLMFFAFLRKVGLQLPWTKGEEVPSL